MQAGRPIIRASFSPREAVRLISRPFFCARARLMAGTRLAERARVKAVGILARDTTMPLSTPYMLFICVSE